MRGTDGDTGPEVLLPLGARRELVLWTDREEGEGRSVTFEPEGATDAEGGGCEAATGVVEVTSGSGSRSSSVDVDATSALRTEPPLSTLATLPWSLGLPSSMSKPGLQTVFQSHSP